MDFQTKGEFLVECFDVDGTKLWEERFHNGGTTGGINDMLNTYFNAGTQITTWYGGLIDNLGFLSLNAADTMASHTGWAENTAYSQANRPQWQPGGPPSGGSITNTTQFVFTVTASAVIKGCFICSNNTKGGNSGILWATGLFSTAQSLVTGQQLKVTYTCTGTPLN